MGTIFSSAPPPLPSTMPAMFEFPPDMAAVASDVNRLDNQALVQYYEREWSAVTR